MGNVRRRTGHRQRAAGWFTASWLMAALPAAIAQGLAPCTQPLGRIVSVQGAADVSRAAAAPVAVAADTPLCAGDHLVVRSRGRVAVLLNNQTVMRLDEGASLTLTEAGEPGGLQVEGLRGRLHVISRTPRRFRVTTPFLNASVDGTEFHVAATSSSSAVQVFEGVVTASNDAGSVRVSSGEQAVARARYDAPRVQVVVRPKDAVAWTVHVPTVVSLDDRRPLQAGPLEPRLQRAAELVRDGRPAEALELLESAPAAGDLAVQRSSLLLQLGRVEEARRLIAGVLQNDPRDSDASALRAMIAVVDNDRDAAIALASEAVAWAPGAPAAGIALSYARQARFDIDGARASVAAVVQHAPDHALAWARLAELELALANLDGALDAAERAVALDAGVAKARTVLGFAQLVRVDPAAAQTAFDSAIRLDQSDPLPWLGRGLARIRRGDLVAGREDIEVAAVLDPLNSTTRSYLGKAYHDERRDARAQTQLELAKQLDPLDPTPYLYDAIRKQAANQPREALEDFERSIELNDNRAVYRSRLLLDEDQASRMSGIARIHEALGFDRLALVEAVRSSLLDPTGYASRLFLADAFGQQERQEIMRSSELLRAQLLQPVNSMPVAPQLSFGGPGFLASPIVGRTGINDYSRLLERDGFRAYLAAYAGNLQTAADLALLSVLKGRTAVSVGQFHFETSGFRPNSDSRHDLYNLFAQTDISPALSVQAELRDRTTEAGDLALRGDPAAFDGALRRTFTNHNWRLGLRYGPSADRDILFSAGGGRLNDRQLLPSVDLGGCVTDILGVNTNRGTQVEAEYISRDAPIWLSVGASGYRVRSQTQILFPGSCLPNQQLSSTDRGVSLFATGTLNLRQGLSLIVGASRDRVRDGNLDVQRWSPRLGLISDWNRRLTLRASVARSVKPALFASQTLRPTSVLGFPILADDTNGSLAKHRAVALDSRIADHWRVGFEFSNRDTDFALNTLDQPTFVRPHNQSRLAYLYWLPRASALSLAATYVRSGTRLASEEALPAGVPSRLVTSRLPVDLRLRLPSGWMGSVLAQAVQQRADIPAESIVGRRSSFALLDASVGYRFRGGSASIDLAVRNLLNRRFTYTDESFLAAEPSSPPFLPRRTVIARISVDL